MLFVSTKNPISALPQGADGVELRLDLFPSINLKELPPFPVILTLRKSSHGGHFQGSEEQREAWIERLLELQPPFLDLECDMREGFLWKVFEKYPKTQCILSYHNLQQTPSNLEPIYQAMSRYPAYTYKIAVTAQSTNDALRTLLFARKHPRVSAICMGEKGAFARVLGPVNGNRVDYTHVGVPTGSGQLSLEELVSIYRFPKLNLQTALYGLIGDPVVQSQGHSYHNRQFEQKGVNAVYVKMIVKPEELADFFPLAEAIGFRGLSVTMPLKTAVIPFLTHIDTSVGAVNTILLGPRGRLGSNTDGKGALDALEKRGSLQGKRLVVVGAGGAGRAIAFEAKRRGAEVWVVNRTLQKAEELSKAIGGFVGMPPHYDILVHCCPAPTDLNLLPSALVMDVVYHPKETPFVQKAKQRGCEVVYGDEMFFNQAAAQSELFC